MGTVSILCVVFSYSEIGTFWTFSKIPNSRRAWEDLMCYRSGSGRLSAWRSPLGASSLSPHGSIWVVQGLEVTWTPGILLPEPALFVVVSVCAVVDLLLNFSPLCYTWEEGCQWPHLWLQSGLSTSCTSLLQVRARVPVRARLSEPRLTILVGLATHAPSSQCSVPWCSLLLWAYALYFVQPPFL